MWDQVLVGAAPGDAITRNAMLLRERLSLLGPSNLYAEHREPGLDVEVGYLDELPSRPNRDRPIIFHASMGSWPVFRALAGEPGIILVYHNFSPPEGYLGFAPSVAGDLVRGRWELARIRDRVVTAIADSEFNARELVELGYRDVTVVPPTPDVDRLARVVPDPAMLATISSWGPGPKVLCVAQQLPHKRIERVIASLAVLQQEHQPDAHLVYVGVDRFAAYTRALHTMTTTTGLMNAHLLGRVTDEELAALYLRADAFLTLSDHEGFCVPVVEAMALGVPVVGSDRGAIPDTVANAGVIVDDPDDPVLVAAVLDRVLSDSHLRWVLTGRGVSRSKQLAAPHSLPRLVEAVCATEADLRRVVLDRLLAGSAMGSAAGSSTGPGSAR